MPTAIKLLAAKRSKIKTYNYCIFKMDLGLCREFKWLFIVQLPILQAEFLSLYNLLIDIERNCPIDNTNEQ